LLKEYEELLSQVQYLHPEQDTPIPLSGRRSSRRTICVAGGHDQRPRPQRRIYAIELHFNEHGALMLDMLTTANKSRYIM
jgi:hypothetical protein